MGKGSKGIKKKGLKEKKSIVPSPSHKTPSLGAPPFGFLNSLAAQTVNKYFVGWKSIGLILILVVSWTLPQQWTIKSLQSSLVATVSISKYPGAGTQKIILIQLIHRAFRYHALTVASLNRPVLTNRRITALNIDG
jgi:hypothetical protein